jgi:ABC-2 type transport system permease protein
MSTAIQGAALFGAEFRRMLRLARSYWLEYAADLLLYALGYLLLITVFRAASTNYGPAGYLSTLIGYTTWKIGASVLVDIARIATEEAQTGTLEQLFLSGLRPGLVFLARSLGILVNRGIRGLVLAFILAAILGLLQPVPPLAVLVFALTLAGACGLGFALAGLALVYKRIGGALHLLWQMLVFFTGALAPIQNIYLDAISKALPLTWGITGLRAILIDGATLAILWQNGMLSGLLINTAFYLSLGVVVFAWGQRRARELGVLAHY